MQKVDIMGKLGGGDGLGAKVPTWYGQEDTVGQFILKERF